MGTRAVIARSTGFGTYKGVYHHWDGYPSGLGAELFRLATSKKYKGKLEKLTEYVLDKHSAGWSSLMPLSETKKPECFCHPKRRRAADKTPNWFTEENIIGSDIEYVYVIDEVNNFMHVIDVHGEMATNVVKFDAPEPDWKIVQCGKNLERCTHMAYYHFPEVENTSMRNLSTEAYLGRRPLGFRDVIAVKYQGIRYEMTGSGRRSHMDRNSTAMWLSSVLAPDGTRLELVTAFIEGDTYEPSPGMIWGFPPTKICPVESFYAIIRKSIVVPSSSKTGVEYTVTGNTCTCPPSSFVAVRASI